MQSSHNYQTKTKPTGWLAFRPLNRLFVKKSSEIMKDEMEKAGLVLPPDYYSDIQDAYFQIGQLYHEYMNAEVTVNLDDDDKEKD